jgi:MFS family permease
MLFLMGAIQMQMIAQGYLVYGLTGSPALLGLVNSAFALPMLLLALFGGALADRFDRKKIIQIAQIGFLLTALAVALTVASGVITWYHLLAASMVMGLVFSFIGPARQAMIPDLVQPENLTNAIALNSAGMSIMTLLAPAFAGVLYAVIGPEGVYFVLAGLGLMAVLVTGLLPKSRPVTVDSDAKILADIGAGITYIRHNPMVRILLGIGLVTALLAMPFRFLMPVFVVDVYDKGPEAMGLLVSAMGLGALAGSLFMAQIGRWKRGLLLIGTTFLTGVALLLVAALPFYMIALVLMLALGLGDAGRRTLNQALIMEVSDAQYRGRVMSVYMLNFALMPLGVLPAGIAAQYFGGQVAVGILAVLLLGITLVILVPQRELRRFT